MSSATQPLITFATAWYEFGTSKFSNTQYYIWAGTLLQNARKFNLIVFVESEQMSKFICNLAKNNPRVIVIIHPFNDLPLCKTHGLQFEMNHQRNHLLNQRVSWKLVLLWCSKQYFVEFVENKCINDGIATQYYGWCDIGYFRSREGRSELMPDEIANFPRDESILRLNPEKIHYALVSPSEMKTLNGYVYNRNPKTGLPNVPIPTNQNSIAGGFFILGGGHNRATKWRNKFENLLIRYLKNGEPYVVKDDQYVIVDYILMNPTEFELWLEPMQFGYDSWFLFQRLLTTPTRK